MQVVEDEDQRTVSAACARNDADGVEEAEPGSFGLGRRGLAQLGQGVAQAGMIWASSAASATELGSQGLGVGAGHVRAQRLDPRPVRRRAAGLPAPAREDGAPGPRRAALSSSARRLLPMPGSPASKQQAAAPGERRLERGVQIRELLARARRRRGPGPRRPGAARAERIERRVLVEDRLLELAQRPARLDARAPRRARPRVSR